MTSPSPGTASESAPHAGPEPAARGAGPARRRQRSARVVVAAALVLLGACSVAGGLLTTTPLLGAAAVLAVLLGALATRIVHTELLDSRREAAADRAELARGYRSLTEERVAEQAMFVRRTEVSMSRQRDALARLESQVVDAETRARAAAEQCDAERSRADLAEREGRRLGERIDDAEGRAAEAIVLLAELEQERDLLAAQLQAAHTQEKARRAEGARWGASATGTEGRRRA